MLKKSFYLVLKDIRNYVRQYSHEHFIIKENRAKWYINLSSTFIARIHMPFLDILFSNEYNALTIARLSIFVWSVILIIFKKIFTLL